MIIEEKRRKMTIFDETISHPEPKFYPRSTVIVIPDNVKL